MKDRYDLMMEIIVKIMAAHNQQRDQRGHSQEGVYECTMTFAPWEVQLCRDIWASDTLNRS
jgi:hypothetical protein